MLRIVCLCGEAVHCSTACHAWSKKADQPALRRVIEHGRGRLLFSLALPVAHASSPLKAAAVRVAASAHGTCPSLHSGAVKAAL
jgi:hypothetical protein